MLSEILTCTDCQNPFCAACDDEYTHCPDCGEVLCGDCAETALEERQARCMGCSDTDVSGVRFPYEEGLSGGRELYKYYVNPERGKLA